MSWYLEVIAGIVLALIIYKGYKNGFVLSIVGVVIFICAYYLSYTLAEPAGQLIYNVTDLYRFAAIPLGGFVVFFLINFLGMIPKFIYKRIMRTEVETEDGGSIYFYKPNIVSSLAGCCIMLPIALFMVSFIYWGDIALNPDGSTKFKRVVSYPAKLAIENGVQSVLENEDNSSYNPEKLSQLISNPMKAAQKINDVINEPTIKQLLTDQSLISAIRVADSKKINNNRALSNLLSNESAMDKLYEVGLVPENYKSKAYKQELVNRMSKVGERMKGIESNPEFKSMIDKFQLQGGITQENVQKLLSDEQFLKLVDKMIYETK